MTLVDALAGAAVPVLAVLVAYAVGAYVLLLYLPSAERLPSGAVADAAFVLTLPLVLALAWLSSAGRRS